MCSVFHICCVSFLFNFYRMYWSILRVKFSLLSHKLFFSCCPFTFLLYPWCSCSSPLCLYYVQLLLKITVDLIFLFVDILLDTLIIFILLFLMIMISLSYLCVYLPIYPYFYFFYHLSSSVTLYIHIFTNIFFLCLFACILYLILICCLC